MKGSYKYRWDSTGGYFSIDNIRGVWLLRFHIPNRIVVIANCHFPTKRAAKNEANRIVWEYYVKGNNKGKEGIFKLINP